MARALTMKAVSGNGVRAAASCSDVIGPALGAGRAAGVALEHLEKSFGSVAAVSGVSLEVAPGEFFSLLGPSGSGKTTCLRMIAGFERPDAGRIVLHGRDVTDVPPNRRDVNTVFQDYALFPHMNVARNVEYGLRVRRFARNERKLRVGEALEMVRLSGLGSRRPSQLSGGQRQRVALARALINRPSVLLLDEPLGALDLKLRQEMQAELKRIQAEVKITFIYVTHDQDEALGMSDRIAVMSAGQIEQVGPPTDLYENPMSRFVANFLGTANIFSGETALALRGSRELFSLRPEKIEIVWDPAVGDVLRARGELTDVTYLGDRTRYVVRLFSRGDLVVLAQNTDPPAVPARPGTEVGLRWDRNAERVLPETRDKDGAR